MRQNKRKIKQMHQNAYRHAYHIYIRNSPNNLVLYKGTKTGCENRVTNLTKEAKKAT
jgi:hypothetical protein